MKIVLSPSKTKTIPDTAIAVRDGQFQPHITQEIVKHVQSLDVAALGKALKLKEDKAQALFDFYQEFESHPVGFACESYEGIAFAYFHKEDWILNLASKEYAKMVNHSKVVTVEFWELRGDTYKQMSTSSKMSRGMMAHACLTKQVKHVRDLPREINGFICATDIESITIPSESMTVRYERK